MRSLNALCVCVFFSERILVCVGAYLCLCVKRLKFCFRKLCPRMSEASSTSLAVEGFVKSCTKCADGNKPGQTSLSSGQTICTLLFFVVVVVPSAALCPF